MVVPPALLLAAEFWMVFPFYYRVGFHEFLGVFKDRVCISSAGPLSIFKKIPGYFVIANLRRWGESLLVTVDPRIIEDFRFHLPLLDSREV